LLFYRGSSCNSRGDGKKEQSSKGDKDTAGAGEKQRRRNKNRVKPDRKQIEGGGGVEGRGYWDPVIAYFLDR